MVNQAKSEYDCVRILREIQIMKKLNESTTCLLKQTNKQTSKPTAKNFTNEPIVSNLFVPQLIDIICPKNSNRVDESSPSTECGSGFNSLNGSVEFVN